MTPIILNLTLNKSSSFSLNHGGDIQQWCLCTVIASDEEECFEFLNRKFAGSDDEIKEAVSEARRFELKNTSQETGINAVD